MYKTAVGQLLKLLNQVEAAYLTKYVGLGALLCIKLQLLFPGSSVITWSEDVRLQKFWKRCGGRQEAGREWIGRRQQTASSHHHHNYAATKFPFDKWQSICKACWNCVDLFSNNDEITFLQIFGCQERIRGPDNCAAASFYFHRWHVCLIIIAPSNSYPINFTRFWSKSFWDLY